MVLETDCIVETSTKTTIGEEEITVTEVVIEMIGPITQITVGPEIGAVTEMVTGIPIDQLTEGKIVVKGMVIETKIMAGLGIEIETGRTGVAPDKDLNPEAVPKTDTRVEQSKDDTRNRDRSESRSRSSSHVSINRDRSRCYRCNEYDHFARECPNNIQGRNTNDAKDSLLRMTDTDQAYTLDDTDGEDFDMALNM